MEKIISATVVSGADAIHRAMGFVGKQQICRAVEKCNIVFIGPPSGIISRLGNKQEARMNNEGPHAYGDSRK